MGTNSTLCTLLHFSISSKKRYFSSTKKFASCIWGHSLLQDARLIDSSFWSLAHLEGWKYVCWLCCWWRYKFRIEDIRVSHSWRDKNMCADFAVVEGIDFRSKIFRRFPFYLTHWACNWRCFWSEYERI